MSIFRKILPFYGIIENAFSSAGRIIENKVNSSEQRKTLKTQAELEIYVKTEYEKKMSEIRQSESKLKHSQEIEKKKIKADLADLPYQKNHERRMEFEKHRVDLFERVKKLEFEIKKQISEFDEIQQQKLLTWHNTLMRSLEDESQKALVKKLPEVLYIANQFQEDEEVYNQFKKRAFIVVDNTIESIKADQELFRESLREMSCRHKLMTEIMVEMSKKFEIAHFDTKMIEDQH